MMSPGTIKAQAATLAASAPARGNAAFLPAAAACHAIAASGGAPGFRTELVWPGHMAAFHSMAAADHLALAAALLALAREAEPLKSAA